MFSLHLEKRKADFDKQTGGKKIDYDFQELGLKLEPLSGKAIWIVFSTPKGTRTMFCALTKPAFDTGRREILATSSVLKRL